MTFNTENAVLHFIRTQNALPFLVKYVVIISAGLLAYDGLWAVLIGSGIIEMAPYEKPIGFAFWWVLQVALFLLLSAIIQAIYLRHYLFGEPFRIALGRDEWNLLKVQLIWIVFLLAAAIATALVLFIPALILGWILPDDFLMSYRSSALIGLFMPGLSLIVIGLLSIRYAPAAALTVRDGSVKFFDAFEETRGKYRPLLVSYFILYAVYAIVLMLVVQPFYSGVPGRLVEFLLLTSQSAPAGSFAAGLLSVIHVAFSVILAGPGALVAKDGMTDKV